MSQASAQVDSNIVVCNLKNTTNDEYVGTCSIPCRVNALNVNFDKLLELCTEATPPRKVSVSLKEVNVKGNFLGKMEGKYPEDPTRFEITDSKYVESKVAKLPFGWFPLQSLQINQTDLNISINAQKLLPASLDDINIIDRTLALLSNEAIWNKNDTRTCPKDSIKLSLFCALTQATIEISGGVHYRQPAHEKVREVLNEVGGNRVKTHRLMDYNNHPDTTLRDVHQLLLEAKARIKLIQ